MAITSITADSITIEQEPAAALEVDSSSPVEAETYSTCQNFDLTFTIHNSGGADALAVTATINPGAKAEVEGHGQGVSWTTPILGDIPGGGTIGPFTYEMHCTNSGDSTITVTPAGTDENTGMAITDITADSVTVEQVPGGLPLWALLLIVIGSCAVVGLWIGVGLLLFRRRRYRRKLEEWKAAGFDTSEFGERPKGK